MHRLGRTSKYLLATALVMALAVALVGADRPATAGGSAKANTYKRCPINGRPFQPDWKYCPWHGELIGTGQPPRPIPYRDPKETVLAFFQAYREAEKNPAQAQQVMLEVLDLESILSEWVAGSLDRWEGLPTKLSRLMKEQAVPEMAQAMVPIVLNILTSPEMREVYTPQGGLTQDFLKLYYLQVEGDRARLNPSSRLLPRGSFAAQTFYLRKKEGRWVIIRMPFFGQ